MAGMFVEDRARPRTARADHEILEPLAVSDEIERQAETDAEGRFTFDPLPAGVLLVQPGGRPAGAARDGSAGLSGRLRAAEVDDHARADARPIEIRRLRTS